MDIVRSNSTQTIWPMLNIVIMWPGQFAPTIFSLIHYFNLLKHIFTINLRYTTSICICIVSIKCNIFFIDFLVHSVCWSAVSFDIVWACLNFIYLCLNIKNLTVKSKYCKKIISWLSGEILSHTCTLTDYYACTLQ